MTRTETRPRFTRQLTRNERGLVDTLLADVKNQPGKDDLNLTLSEQTVYIFYTADGKYAYVQLLSKKKELGVLFFTTKELAITALKQGKLITAGFTEEHIFATKWEDLIQWARELEEVDYLIRYRGVVDYTEADIVRLHERV
jgi:hypothetical protein